MRVSQDEQPAPPLPDHDPQTESLKVERNTKGYNWSVRVVPDKEKGESLEDAKVRLDRLVVLMGHTYGFPPYRIGQD
jgi:hypothetical protein